MTENLDTASILALDLDLSCCLLTVMLKLMQTMHVDRKKDKEREDLFLRQMQYPPGEALEQTLPLDDFLQQSHFPQ